MNFADIEFWINLSLGLFIAFAGVKILGWLLPHRESDFSKIAFSLISLFLLYSESVLTMLAFLWVVLWGWVCVKYYHKKISSSGRKFVWCALIVIQLLPLFYFKYWFFVCTEVFHFNVAMPHALIPMGLSFYSFQVISVCIDSEKEGLEAPRFIDYFNFAAFFPQIVAGPIERRKNLLPQIENLKLAITKSSVEKAVPWVVLGLFYKMVLADNLAVIGSLSRVDATNVYHVLAEMVTFSMRIYFDFAGYSFVALGLGYLFGVRLTLNFDAPYWSLNLRDFWSRWHVTLSQWLRDYVYIPLGGSRRGIVWLSVLITFMVSGIWHGAGWNFLLWGTLHALGLIALRYLPKWRFPKTLSWAVTMMFVGYTWLFFYETDTSELWNKSSTLLNISNYLETPVRSVMGFVGSRSDAVFCVFICILSLFILMVEGCGIRKINDPYRYLTSFPACLFMAFLITILAPIEESTFIYFNF